MAKQEALRTEQMDAPQGFRTRPLSPYVGLEILGVDLDRDLDPETIENIRAAWIDAGVLLFRGCGHSTEAQMRLSRCFGELQPSANKELNLDSNPYLLNLAYDPNSERAWTATLYEVGGQVRAGWLGWHWDQSFVPRIVRGAVLRMIQVPAAGGETGFMDAIGAYDRLPESLKKRIEDLEIVYEFVRIDETERNRFGFPKDLRAIRKADVSALKSKEGITGNEFPPVVHPLVITQRETGRKVLKLSPMHSQYILGMEPAESDALLHELADHLVDPRYAYFHTWQKDDMIVWDNWRGIHCANGVPPECARHVQRTTIIGDYEFGRYLDPAHEKDAPTNFVYD
jgi:taurine dioxygenase